MTHCEERLAIDLSHRSSEDEHPSVSLAALEVLQLLARENDSRGPTVADCVGFFGKHRCLGDVWVEGIRIRREGNIIEEQTEHESSISMLYEVSTTCLFCSWRCLTSTLYLFSKLNLKTSPSSKRQSAA